MRSSDVSGGQVATAQQYDDLRRDAYGSSQLLVHQQSTPGMTVHVENGVCFVGATKVAFAGGNSPTFTAPVSNPRIDLLVISSAGALSIIQGTEAASPVAPAYSEVKLTLAEIYNVVGETQIYDNDKQVGGQGYIKTDARPLLVTRPTSINHYYGGSFETTYTNNSGRPQIHIVAVYMQVGGVTGDASGHVHAEIEIDGNPDAQADYAWVPQPTTGTSSYVVQTLVAVCPPGSTYRVHAYSSGNANSNEAGWAIVTL